MEVSIDLSDAIQQALADAGHNVSADPLPTDFDQHLPFSRIQTLEGGTRTDVVIDTRTVQVETWAENMADAMVECSIVAGRIVELQGETLGGVPCYSVELMSLPAEDYDPYHKDLSMASATARVRTRVMHIQP